MKFYKKSTLKLSKKDIHEIIYLKNTHWKFGYSSQFNWFKTKQMFLKAITFF